MKKVLWFFLLVMSGQLAHGNGYQVMLQSNRAMAMGNTATGLVMGGASIFFNPGALGFVNQSEVMVGLNPVFGRVNYVPENGFNQYENRSNTLSGHAYYVWADSASKFRAGIGFFAPFGSTTEWEEGWIGRHQLTSLSLAAYFIQPTVAYKISDKLSIGAGLDIVLGSVNLQRDINAVALSDGSEGSIEFDGKANTGIGFNVGLFFMPSEKISVGLNYRSQVMTVVEGGDVTISRPEAAAGLLPASTKFDAELPLPSVFSIGLGIYPSEKLTLGVDLNVVGWSAYESLTFNFAEPIAGADVSANARNYENSIIFHIGGEYKVSDMIDLRAGFYYDQSPVQDGYMTPETPDANAMGYTFGLGIKPSSKLGIDVSLLYLDKEQRENIIPTGVATGGINGTYKAGAIIPGLAFTYKF